jgi:hypothetical protein
MLVIKCTGYGFWERKHSSNYLIVIALILAGAFWKTLILFYGVIFDDSHSQLAIIF